MGESTFKRNWCHFAYSHFAYLLPHGAISPTQAKCDQNNVEQLKTSVQIYKVKGIVQKQEIKSKFKRYYEQKFL